MKFIFDRNLNLKYFKNRFFSLHKGGKSMENEGEKKSGISIFHSDKTFFHSIIYGLYATIPLFLHYAITKTTSILDFSQMDMVLTSELIIRKMTTLFGLFPDGFIAIFWIAFIFVVYLREKKEYPLMSPQFSDIIQTIKRSLPYAGALLGAAFIVSLMQPSVPDAPHHSLYMLPLLLGMKSGAGFLEEFLCRMILLGGILWGLKKTSLKYETACIIALSISSFAFAEIHYFHFFPQLGSYFGYINDPANPFTLGGFLFRFMSGAFLGYVYIRKGFATVAWTHAIYGYFSLLPIFM